MACSAKAAATYHRSMLRRPHDEQHYEFRTQTREIARFALQDLLPVVDDNRNVVVALSVVGEVPENFTRLVLLCIEAKFCK